MKEEFPRWFQSKPINDSRGTTTSVIRVDDNDFVHEEDDVPYDLADSDNEVCADDDVDDEVNIDHLIEENTIRSYDRTEFKGIHEKAQIESNLSNTNDDMDIELSKEILMELQNNTYHGRFDEDVVDHVAKVLEILDLINIPNVDTHRLRMKVFPLSLVDDARQWWINMGEGKITTWEELIDKILCKFYPDSYDGEDEMLDDEDNWGIDPLEFISRVYNLAAWSILGCMDTAYWSPDLAKKKSTMLVKYLQSGNLEVLES
ncbi:hypothetical protein Tco_0744555 [Tanacetum coccineum]